MAKTGGPIYRRLSIQMWGDRKFRALSRPQPNARDLWVYLLTNEHTRILPGLYCISPYSIAEQLTWPVAATKAKLQEILDKGMAYFDSETRLIWLPNGVYHNPPDNSNQVKGWARHFAEMPECDVRKQALEGLDEYFTARDREYGKGFRKVFHEQLRKCLPKGFLNPFLDTLPNSIATQEQEQEQDQKQEQEQEAEKLFLKFLENYPARNSKKLYQPEARERFKDLSPEDQVNCVQAALNYADSEMISQGIGIKDPHRFLKDGKGYELWKDWIEPETAPGKNFKALAEEAKSLLNPTNQSASLEGNA